MSAAAYSAGENDGSVTITTTGVVDLSGLENAQISSDLDVSSNPQLNSLTGLGTGADDGDLIATTDFRDVYATVLGDVLGTDPGAVLGSGRRSLGFVKT